MDTIGKTKVCALLYALVAAGNAFGLFELSPENIQAINALLGCGVIWGFRDAISKNGTNQ